MLSKQFDFTFYFKIQVDGFLKSQKMNTNSFHQDNSFILFTHLMEMDSKAKYISIFNMELTDSVGDILLLGQAICASPKRFSKMMTLNLTKVF
jgi:hypothetical protein